MNKLILLPGLALAAGMALCNSGDTETVSPVESRIKVETITGFVWEDTNADGILSPNEDEIDSIEVLTLKYDEDGNQIPSSSLDSTYTDVSGWFEFEMEIGERFRLDFILPDAPNEEPRYIGFTKRDVGSEQTDSDVDEKGRTDIFTVTEGFFPTLSAGLVPAKPPAETNTIGIEDPRNDCVERGQSENQACEGDIHHCEISMHTTTGRFEFSCNLGHIADYTQFDLYVSFNLDGDADTGKSEGQVRGVDAELYLNSQAPRIQINHYDAAGNYLGGDVLDPTTAQPVFGITGEDKIGIILSDLPDEVVKLLGAGAETSFTLVSYLASGIQLIDDTAVLPERISFNRPE